MNFSGRYGLLAVAGWVALIGASLYFNVARDREDVIDQAKIQARTAIQKDILYRRWNASLGSLYAEVSSATLPNPYLASMPERDIETSSPQKMSEAGMDGHLSKPIGKNALAQILLKYLPS